jgi:hypothetical protein
MPDEFIYLVLASCPFCEAVVGHADRFESPVPVDRDVPITAEFCPRCGVNVAESADGWALQEETEVARVLPVQERREVPR